MDVKWSPSTGQNIVTRFKPTKETRFRARGKGVDRRGEPVYNEFLIEALYPEWSNEWYTLARVRSGLRTITMRIQHNTRYLTPTTPKV